MSRPTAFMVVVVLVSVCGCLPPADGNRPLSSETVDGPVMHEQSSMPGHDTEIANDAGNGSLRKKRSITTFAQNARINKGDAYDIVMVEGRGTSVEVLGGAINELILKETSHAALSGGTIRDMVVSDNCTTVISGGQVGVISANGANSVTVQGNARIALLQPYGATDINMDSYEACVETIQYPSTCGCVDLSLRNRLTLSRGVVHNLGIGSTDVFVTVRGRDLDKSAYGGAYGFGTVKGQWQNGARFLINLMDKSTYSHLDLHELSSAGDGS